MSQQADSRRSAASIRQQFLDFFVERAGHTVVPSSPVVPFDDPTLLFANAGMNQFKPIFLGSVEPGSRFEGLKRAVDSQKCIRAGGKHNDLDDVGRDTYHHTFFEMLGNWSFGDYFKEEAVQWAWELLTDIWGLDPNRLYATYFEGDKSLGLDADREAYDLWTRYLPPERVLPGNTKDNFWDMGDTGPCGPCSELHYDSRPEQERASVPGYQLVNRDSPTVIEIWNLVFIQYNRTGATSLEPLPAKHVDTGMGFERIVAALQGKQSNYDTDVFSPIFDRIREITGAKPYGGSMTDKADTAYRILADHARCLSVAIADGAEPSNDGRGYVLRRILRRAVRHGRQTMNMDRPFLADVVPAVVETVGAHFPEVRERASHIRDVIEDEEASFRRTLDQGMKLFDMAVETATNKPAGEGHLVIAASDAFKLHDTYGFPIDLTQVMAEERGLAVDAEGFDRLMTDAREQSRSHGKRTADAALSLPPSAIDSIRKMQVAPTEDEQKFQPRAMRATLQAIWNGTDFDQDIVAANTRPTDRFALVFDKTCYYAEMGGQVADVGRVRAVGSPDAGEFEIEDVRAQGGYVLHVGRLRKGRIRVGDALELRIDERRRAAIASNHTATHLLNRALRSVLGESVDQKGSLVAPERLRFDFSHSAPVEDAQLLQIESMIAEDIAGDLVVDAKEAPLAPARSISGLRAVFGETYPDPVRVVSIGQSVDELLADPSSDAWSRRSIEFCGGTHLRTTGEAGAFALIGEEGVSKGVRRVSAVTGAEARAVHATGERLGKRIEGASSLLDQHLAAEVTEIRQHIEQASLSLATRHSLEKALAPLVERVKKLEKAAASAGREEAVSEARRLAEKAAGPIIVLAIPAGADRQALLSAMDAVRARHPDAGILLASADAGEGKVAIVASVAKDLVGRGLKAGDWVRVASQACGGKGGGRPDAAQGGGTEPDKLAEALDQAKAFASDALS
ncbi:MAG: alanine--tRNA ligase [Planctomycetota bacterium]